MMTRCALLLIAAVILDRILGDPAYRLHPVRLMGKTIQTLEGHIRSWKFPALWGGVLLVAVSLVIWMGGLLCLYAILAFSGAAVWLLTLYLVYSCIAFRDLAHHIKPIIFAVKGNELKTARELLQKVVGRDTTVLDWTGIIRAAVETTAESLVDGFLSPLFWFFVAAAAGSLLGASPCVTGGVGIVSYRLINTLDSMVGYRNDRYILFGRFAARLDDVMNFIPARLSLLFLFFAALVLKMDARAGLETARRDRLRGASPNAAHPESFVAGALHIQLGGPTRYAFGETVKPYLGPADSPPRLPAIEASLRLVSVSGYLAVSVFSLILILLAVF